MTSMAASLRDRLSAGPALMAPGAYDPLSARMVELAGFEAVYLTGGGFARAQGFPDLGLVTLSESVEHVARVADTVTIPVIADLDTGYGNALNVVRSVRAFERAGAAAFHIEDQVYPKKCGHYEGKGVIEAKEMIGKIHAAVDTRTTDAVIIARTDARAVEGLDSAIERVGRYLDAGADLGFVEAPQSRDELRAITTREPRAAMANIFEGGKTPFVGLEELTEWGYRLIIYPSQTHRAALGAIAGVLAAMRANGSTTDYQGRLVSFPEREELVGTAEWYKWESLYGAGA
jgi:2-methylisocitrate lyase-like PEP mutase family enzyme